MIDDALRSYRFAGVERPPRLWNASYDEAALHVLVDALVDASGQQAAELTIGLSNVVIDQSAADERMPEGEYVALTVSSDSAWARDDRWPGSDQRPNGFFAPLQGALISAGARTAYSRLIGDGSSVTVLFPRLEG